MTQASRVSLTAMLLAFLAIAWTARPVTADPAADAELLACATYLAADNSARMQMLAELDMMAGEGGGKAGANEIAATLATECRGKPNSLLADVLDAMAAH